jgi:acetyl esterase/lipase
VLRDGYPRVEVSFPGGVTGYPALIYAQPPGYRPNTLDIYMPAAARDERLPLVVYIHGGGWTSGHTRHSGAFSDWPGVLAGIAAHGYVVASLNYRLSGEAPSPAAIHDVKSAVKWLRANAGVYGIDGSTVLTFGGSAGGQLAALAATSCGVADLSPPNEAMALPGVTGNASDQSDCVQGGAIWYGVFDFAPLVAAGAPAANPNAYLDCTPGACSAEAVSRASAVAHVSEDDPPFLLVHGANDRVVAADQSRSFAEALKAKGVGVTLDIIPDVDHSFIGATPEATRVASLRALAETVAFFDRVSGKGN